MLRTLQDIESTINAQTNALAAQFGDPTAAQGLLFVQSRTTQDDIANIEQSLHVPLPASFVRTILRYDVGQFRLGSIVFGDGGEYSKWLIGQNSKECSIPWWPDSSRPLLYVMIGVGDPWMLLLNCDSGQVKVFNDTNPGAAFLVARDFEVFIRGLGTVMIDVARVSDRIVYCAEVVEQVGAAERSLFWAHEIQVSGTWTSDDEGQPLTK